MSQVVPKSSNAEMVERVVIGGDLSQLKAEDEEGGSMDPTEVGPFYKGILLLDVTSYWKKGVKEMGVSVYAKRVKVTETASAMLETPDFVE